MAGTGTDLFSGVDTYRLLHPAPQQAARPWGKKTIEALVGISEMGTWHGDSLPQFPPVLLNQSVSGHGAVIPVFGS